MSCGAGRRQGSDTALLWLWWRPVAAAPIQYLAWKPPYATGVALKQNKAKTKQNKQTNKNHPKASAISYIVKISPLSASMVDLI